MITSFNTKLAQSNTSLRLRDARNDLKRELIEKYGEYNIPTCFFNALLYSGSLLRSTQKFCIACINNDHKVIDRYYALFESHVPKFIESIRNCKEFQPTFNERPWHLNYVKSILNYVEIIVNALKIEMQRNYRQKDFEFGFSSLKLRIH